MLFAAEVARAATNHDRSPSENWSGVRPEQRQKGTSRGFLHVVSQYPVLGSHLDGIASNNNPEALRTAAQRRHERQLEYTEALIENILHHAVACVHLLLERAADETFIADQILNYPHAHRYVHLLSDELPGGDSDAQRIWKYATQNKRICFPRLGRWMLYSDAFGYARRQLAGHVCVVQNSDISLSLDPLHTDAYQSLATESAHNQQPQANSSIFTTPEGRKKVFVLSRSTLESLPTCHTTAKACDVAARAGSYDTYIFESPLPEALEWQGKIKNPLSSGGLTDKPALLSSPPASRMDSADAAEHLGCGEPRHLDTQMSQHLRDESMSRPGHHSSPLPEQLSAWPTGRPT